MALDRQIVRAPDFPPVDWLNALEAPPLAGLRGRSIFVEFWDFTCINCLRTLPAVRDWHERYREAGLAVLGVHTPEFPFARDPLHVQAAVGRLGIRWPVALDNDQAIWTAFANHAWPTIYLIDADGYIRLRHVGEGGYTPIEEAVRALLAETGLAPSALPPIGPAGEQEEGEGAVCFPATPELQTESLGNGPIERDKSRNLTLPHDRVEGSFYLDGEWRERHQGLSLVSEAGEAVLPFQASAVHAVLSPFPGAEASSHLEPVFVEALLDGAPVAAGHYGRDLFHRQGSTWLRVDDPRLYDIAVGLEPGPHELRLRCASPGWSLYAFTFQACLLPTSTSRSAAC
jgi:thiol-disulfide isomerase/thioredoxin